MLKTIGWSRQGTGGDGTRLILSQIWTVPIANKEKREPRRLIGPKFALSGPDSHKPRCQNPAKAREFLRQPEGSSGKSLQPVT